MSDVELICVGCEKYPDQIDEYVEAGRESGMSAADYVLMEEGTLNPENGHFLCTACYIKAGMPSKPYPEKWVAP